MNRIGSLCGLVLLLVPLACSSRNGMSVAPRTDAGADASSGATEDGRAAAPDLASPSDPPPSPDGPAVTPEAGKSDASAPPSDSVSMGQRDTLGDVSGSDGKGPGDDANLLKSDGKEPPDDASVSRVDGKTPPEDAYLPKADGKTPPEDVADTAKADAAKDLGEGEAGIVVSGVEVIPYENYGSADSTCVQATASWVDAVTTYLAEDRKCWTDADCQYVSFSNACGQVCPVPMNVQRVGEFAQHAVGDFDPKCSTCPVLTDYPNCPAPPGDGSVICSSSVCVWK